jgi:hypothetical protein
MSKPGRRSACPTKLFGSGGVAGTAAISRWRTNRAEDESPAFPPLEQSSVKALACELVSETEQPLSRQSTADITRRVNAALDEPMSRSTVWRILDADAIKPWRYRYWIFPRDERFSEKAARILDLYAGIWEGNPLGNNDFVISSDEKTSIQARIRRHESVAPEAGRPLRIEAEYKRGGALQYLAAWDVQRGLVFGRCEPKTGIVPFSRLVDQVMQQEPYCSADRVFWVVDNGSSHRGQAAVKRMRDKYPNAILVHTPVHGSWLNQIEIYFSIIQRKVLTPNDFTGLDEVRSRLWELEKLHNEAPRPFAWNFDRTKLKDFMERLNKRRVAVGKMPLAIAL